MADVSKYDDVIDSRDVVERIEELETELAEAKELVDADGDGTEEYRVGDKDVTDEWNELKTLKALADEAAGYAPDWQYGETLIRDSYFKEYAMELAEDIGAINSEASWPNTCIDWDQAARELQMDYTAVDFEDVTYWIR